MLVQRYVTLALNMKNNVMVPQVLSASPLSLARRVPLTEIHSVQLIVVQLLGHFATRLETSTRALFEGVLIVQVIVYKLVETSKIVAVRLREE